MSLCVRTYTYVGYRLGRGTPEPPSASPTVPTEDQPTGRPHTVAGSSVSSSSYRADVDLESPAPTESSSSTLQKNVPSSQSIVPPHGSTGGSTISTGANPLGTSHSATPQHNSTSHGATPHSTSHSATPHSTSHSAIPLGSSSVPHGSSSTPLGSSSTTHGSTSIPLGSRSIPLGSSSIPHSTTPLSSTPHSRTPQHESSSTPIPHSLTEAVPLSSVAMATNDSKGLHVPHAAEGLFHEVRPTSSHLATTRIG